MKIKTVKLLCAASMSLMLAACGGGSGSALDQEKNAINKISSSSTASSYSSSGVVDTTSPAKIGYGEGGNFVQNVIGSDKPAGDLSAGGTVVLTVNVVSVTHTLVTTPVEITFNSPCFAHKEAILKVGDTATNKVTAENGSASITYTANGCVGNDEITAGASINGVAVNARLTMPVASDQVQSIKFADTTPTQISLAGSGGTETSLVRFQVRGATGAPMKDVAVSFALSTAVGGLKLTNSSLKTDSQGYASTTVQAGSIHTSVRVTATAVLSGIFTTSSQLIVSTGIPDQDSMSLAATDTHPIGWDIDGVESTLTIRLADAFNNPPPLDTDVAFRTEGGTIIDGCKTNASGVCSVKWTSGAPRPTRNAPDNFSTTRELTERKLCVDSNGDWVSDYAACRLERAGRVTVLATAIGNESFTDSNANGIFDIDDIFKTALDGGDCRPNVPILSGHTPPNSSAKPCDDLSEAYLDKDESGTRGTDEEFIDVTSVGAESVPDSVYTAGNGKYNGVLCMVEGPTCTRSQVTIRESMTLVMTSKYVLLRDGAFPFVQTVLPYVDGIDLSYSTSFLLADINGHGVGAGTTLSLDTSNLAGGSAGISTKGPLLASDDPAWIGIGVTYTSSVPSGSFNIDVKTKTILGDIINPQSVAVLPTVLIRGGVWPGATLGETGFFTINGATINVVTTDTLSSLATKINAASNGTLGVTASSSGGRLLLLRRGSITIGAGSLSTTTNGGIVTIDALDVDAKDYYPSTSTQ